jgi:hypothetical protein
MPEVIAVVTFTVRDPVSVNAAYARSRGAGGDRHLTRAGREFKQRVAAEAIVARQEAGWPPAVTVNHARVSYELFDYRGDTDGPCKLAKDALEGILYANDRVAEDGPHRRPVKDGLGKRIVMTVEVLAVVDAATVREREEVALRRKSSRVRRARKAQLAKPRWI